MTSTDFEQPGEVVKVDFASLIPQAARERAAAEKQRRAAMTPEEREAEDQAKRRADLVEASKRIRGDCRRDSGLVGDMLTQTFDAYRIRSDSQRAARQACKSFLSHFETTKRGPALWGRSGVGKSHLLRATCLAALDRDVVIHVKYLDCVTLGPAIKQNPELVSWALNCQLLALDDIGKALLGKRAPWAYEALVDILQTVDSRGWPKLACTCQVPLRTIRANGEVVQKGLEESNTLKDYVLGRLEKQFVWLQVEGPNGRSTEYLDESDDGNWWAS